MSVSKTRAQRSFTRRAPRSYVALAAASVAVLAVALAVLAAALVQAPDAFAASGITPNDSKAKKFVGAISVDDITHHQIALQQIASLNDDTREVFSTGYQESLDYVVVDAEGGRLQPAGQHVQLSRLGGVAAAGPEHGLADAEDLRPRRRRGQRPADGRLHHDGELADQGAHQRARVPGRRDRRSADRRIGQRLHGRRLRRRVRQGRARPARHVPVRRRSGRWPRRPAPPA